MKRLARGERVWTSVARFVGDDRGQDLIEYALLTTIVGVSGILAFSAFSDRMGTAYGEWNDAAQDVWEPCDPGAGGCSHK